MSSIFIGPLITTPGPVVIHRHTGNRQSASLTGVDDSVSPAAHAFRESHPSHEGCHGIVPGLGAESISLSSATSILPGFEISTQLENTSTARFFRVTAVTDVFMTTERHRISGGCPNLQNDDISAIDLDFSEIK